MEALETIEKVFAHNLRALRGKSTQAEMAELLGIPFRTYQNMESGAVPQADTRTLIAKKLQVSETRLFMDPDLTKPAPSQALQVLSDIFQSENKRKLLDLLSDLTNDEVLPYLQMIQAAVRAKGRKKG